MNHGQATGLFAIAYGGSPPHVRPENQQQHVLHIRSAVSGTEHQQWDADTGRVKKPPIEWQRLNGLCLLPAQAHGEPAVVQYFFMVI